MSVVITPFMEEVAQIAWTLADEDKLITVEGILDVFDAEKDFDKKRYRNMYNTVYNALRSSTKVGFTLWTEYSNTQKYRLDYKHAEYYLQGETEETWRDDYFRTLYDMRAFTKGQMEDSIVEAKLFENFLEALRKTNVLFVIAGRGARDYRQPTYHDFCIYKYRNLITTAKIADRQIRDMADAQLMLPHGVDLPSLESLGPRFIEALEYKSVEEEEDEDEEAEEEEAG